MDHPPGSRLFVVCGKAAEGETLWTAFEAYGTIQNIKLVRQKGVAFVKFETASSAARAIESLDRAVLNHGRGPRLKVLLAEAFSSRSLRDARAAPSQQQHHESEILADPDNIPPRSRLFMAVPRTSDGPCINFEMSRYSGLEYCKTDLISTKGILFAKFSRASSALEAMEKINETSMVAGYRVACMLAEPKTKKAQIKFTLAVMEPEKKHSSYASGSNLTTTEAFSLTTPTKWVPSVLGMEGSSSIFSSTFEQPALQAPGHGIEALQVVQSSGATGNALDFIQPKLFTTNPHGGLPKDNIHLSTKEENLSPALLSRQRLFVVVFKAVPQDVLAKLFRKIPGMEYCDLKKDKWTGKSKGFAYVNYSTHEAAQAAIYQFSGMELPAQSGHCLRVMFAKLLGVDSDLGSTPGLSSSLMSRSLEQETQWNDQFANYFVDDCVKSGYHGHFSHTGINQNDCTVFMSLTRPLPEYAIRHLFSGFGEVENVLLGEIDKRHGTVKFATVEGAQAALRLDGSSVLGETLKVDQNCFFS